MQISPLSAEAFAAYGDVLEVSKDKKHFPINDGFTERFHDIAEIDVADENGQAIVSIFRSTPLALPIKIEMMERHPLGSQAFMPLSQQPYLVVVPCAFVVVNPLCCLGNKHLNCIGIKLTFGRHHY